MLDRVTSLRTATRERLARERENAPDPRETSAYVPIFRTAVKECAAVDGRVLVGDFCAACAELEATGSARAILDAAMRDVRTLAALAAVDRLERLGTERDWGSHTDQVPHRADRMLHELTYDNSDVAHAVTRSVEPYKLVRARAEYAKSSESRAAARAAADAAYLEAFDTLFAPR